MVNIKNMVKNIEELQNQTVGLINENITEEMEASMTTEQKELIEEARKGLNFKGLNSSEKLANITQILAKNGF